MRGLNAPLWLGWVLVALSYVVVFVQRISPSTVVDLMMADFRAGASGIGVVMSAYFYGYTVMQFPAGVIVDRWGVRRAVLLSLMASAIGTIVFATATGVATAAAARAVVAIGDAFVFTSLLKLARQVFPAKRFGLMSGVGQSAGFVGGLLATTPFVVLVSERGWRTSFTLLAGLVLVNAAFCVVLLREPVGPGQSRHLVTTLREALQGVRSVDAWAPLLTAVGSYVTFVSLASVWGIPLLMQGYSMSRRDASVPLFAFMAAYAICFVIFGYLGDIAFKSLRIPLLFMGALRIGLLLLLAPAIGGTLPRWALIAEFIGLGALGGAVTPLLVIYVKEAFPDRIFASVAGANTALANLASAVIQPILGLILERHWDGAILDGTRIYPATSYTWLIGGLAIVSLTSVVGPWFLSERRCLAIPERAAVLGVQPRRPGL